MPTEKVTIKVEANENYYYLWIKDSEGNESKSNKIVVKAPEKGTLIAKEENKNGSNYDLTKSTWTDKNVYIEAVGQQTSEKITTTYTVRKGVDDIYIFVL